VKACDGAIAETNWNGARRGGRESEWKRQNGERLPNHFFDKYVWMPKESFFLKKG